MKKKILYLTVAIMNMMTLVMAGCSFNQDESFGDFIESEMADLEQSGSDNELQSLIESVIEEVETTVSEETAESYSDENSNENADSTDEVDLKDVKHQLSVIEENFEDCKNQFIEQVAYTMDAGFAVTDFNHNGRLELILSLCQGTGAFSTTFFYEVNEDYTSLEPMSTIYGDAFDNVGDFLEYDQFACYELNDVYYYVVEDYSSAGWDYKGIDYYLYSFDGKVNSVQFSGFLVQGTMDQDGTEHYHLNLYDLLGNLCSSEEEYINNIEIYLEDFEKKSSCKIHWMNFDEDESWSQKINASYEGFDAEYGAYEPDYCYYKQIYGENTEFIIE